MEKRRTMELLAPAGELEIAKAALRAGADACYIGGQWSARAFAKNFDEQEIDEVVSYAHARAKKIYVALNTMLYEREMQQALDYTRFLYEAGVDAVIAADLGYISQVRSLFPQLPIHVSTQAGVQCGLGAELMRELGCRRVVAARECTFADLKEMASHGIEVEAFCHGALCSSVSGACLMSGMIGGRSGNRGRCAQPCRQEYTLLGSKGYHLSTKDLCTLSLISQFAEAGVCSLKIEGRMKKQEYVVSAAAAYRKALDAYQEGYAVDVEEMQAQLAVIFNRGGFGQGYLTGGKDVTYPRRQNHMGLYLGKIQNIQKGKALLCTSHPLQKGDSVEIGSRGFALAYADKAANGWYIPVPKEIKEGQSVFLKSSPALLRAVQQMAEREAGGRRVQLEFAAREGGMARLTAHCGEHSAQAEFQVEQIAQKPVLEQAIREKLSKSGGTDFTVDSCSVQVEGNPFLPAAALNGLRRQVLGQLAEHLQPAPVKREQSAAVRYCPMPKGGAEQARYIAAQVATAEQAQAASEAGVERIYAAPWDERQLREIVRSGLPQVWLVLSPYLDEKAADWAREFLTGEGRSLVGLIAPNPGAVQLARELHKPWIADYWMNAANCGTEALLEDWGAVGYAVSAEIDGSSIRRLKGNKEQIAYGRLPLMNLRHCPVRRQSGCGACGSGQLQDKLGYRFPLGKLWAGECLTQVYNAVPIALQELREVEQAGVTGLRLIFTQESARQTRQIAKAYQTAWQRLSKVALQQLNVRDHSNGHFYRGVE